MKRTQAWSTLGPLVAMLLGACASTPPPAAAPAATTARTPADETARNDEAPPPGQKRYHWTKATDAEVAAALDKKFAEAAKGFVQLKRNDQLMFCKRYREMGSSIRTLHCITEAELRKQVEDSDQVREQMRNKMGKCNMSAGCGAGF